jgi:hypothetical protein
MSKTLMTGSRPERIELEGDVDVQVADAIQ